ncbi:MAG: CsgG/HfaB family protein, partial [Candidatus Marinimicrobia bacterium]|nr:CsgG/HfaB family protein [Candidatus Neomarinimicrobiota bacterium]
MALLKQILLVLFITEFSLVMAQELYHDLTLEKKSVVILSSQNDKDPESATRRITNIVSSKAVELGRFNIIDRTHIESILSEQKFQLSGIVDEDQIVEIGNMAAADEAILVKIITFGQRGVPPKKKPLEKDEEENEYDDNLLEWIIKESVSAVIDKKLEDVERHPNNIQTIIQAEVRLLNIESGSSKNSFRISATYTGGNKTSSLNRALNKLDWQIGRNLREFYMIASEVIEKNGNDITILTGNDMGLEEGTIFEVNSPGREKKYKDRSVTLPGKPRALAILTKIGKNTSRARIVRQWKKVKEGHRANEMIYDPTTTDLAIKINGHPVLNLTGNLWLNPFKKIAGSLTGQIGFLKDTRKENNIFYGLGWEAKMNVVNQGKFQLSIGTHLPLNFTMRTDDESNLVRLTFFNPSINLTGSLILQRKNDIFIGLHYVTNDNIINDWYYSETEEKEDGTE